MKRNLLKTLLIIGVSALFGTIIVNAQTNLIGKYKFEAKDSIDGKPDNYTSLFELTIELNEKNRAVLTKTKSELTDWEKSGSWTWNKTKNLLTATFPAGQDKQGETYPKITITFKLDGENLKVVKILPAFAGKTGDVFAKV